MSADYTGSFDNEKADRDLDNGQADLSNDTSLCTTDY